MAQQKLPSIYAESKYIFIFNNYNRKGDVFANINFADCLFALQNCKIKNKVFCDIANLNEAVFFVTPVFCKAKRKGVLNHISMRFPFRFVTQIDGNDDKNNTAYLNTLDLFYGYHVRHGMTNFVR